MSTNRKPATLQTLLLCGSTSVPYAVRESPRAKNVLLKVRKPSGLEVVVPVGFDWGVLPAMLERKKGWIERHLDKIRECARPCDPGAPDQIELRAVGCCVTVTYESIPGRRLRLLGGLDGVRLRGTVSNEGRCRELLRDFLKSAGRELLPPWLSRLGERHGLAPAGCTVRLQKTRWGSCSAKGRISLNAKLLFLPTELAEYVLLHELAHLRRPNHSPAYWGLMGSLAPAYRQREAELRQAGRYVPGWVEIG